MDMRDNLYTQVATLASTLRALAKNDNFSELVVEEQRRILTEHADYIERFILPKITMTQVLIDLRPQAKDAPAKVATFETAPEQGDPTDVVEAVSSAAFGTDLLSRSRNGKD